jgi:flagellin
MRIQHNIMAMNAYRNYNTNTSALSKNLEKLSSGYKINRAGDDAAGLAISEKMRAQITGLNAAQKNVKDGISLVKTAEGAMQEIQDMLNRMDYLATQSANGTYDNEVDRANLQKEVDNLKTEINRIADSANFNGIKLLDGSLDGSAKAAVAGKVSEINIPKAGDQLGVDTILHQEGSGNGEATTFKVDLADFQFAANDGETMTVKVGDNTFELTADNTATGPLTGEDIVAAITGDGTAPTGVTVKLNGNAYTAGSDVAFGGQDFEISAEGNKLVFTQKNAPTTEAEEVDGKMDVVISGATAAANGSIDGTATDAVLPSDADNKATFTADEDALTAVAKKLGVADASNIEIKKNGANLELTADGKVLGTVAAPAAALTANTTLTFKDADGNDIGSLALVCGGNADIATTDFDTAIDTGLDYAAPAAGNGLTTGGDFNVQTIEVTNGTAEKRDRLASTVVKLTEDMFQDGATITIADKTIQISADAADKDDATKVYIGDMVGDGKKLDLKVLSERLSQAAAGNNAWTVSAIAGKPGITLMEKTNADGTSAADAKWDLTTEKGIKETLSFKSADTAAVAADDSKSLTLQIGDTSESFNQMKVQVGDMHTDAMGTGTYIDENGKEVQITKTIADIDISNQAGAAEAINVIKNAINYVSGVRGDLGAIQNRLEHTGNNLSVMAENIQDAESTIRDTDVAEEMMSYVKNNILVQSAQAMLAQANQVPQGVLQLLG